MRKRKKNFASPLLSPTISFPRVFSHLPARPVINQRPPATPLARLTVRPLFPHPHFFLSQETLTFISPAPLHSSLLSSSDSLTTPRQKKDSHPNDRPCLRHPLRPKGVGTPLEPAAEARRRRSGGGDQSFFCHAPQFFFSLSFSPLATTLHGAEEEDWESQLIYLYECQR